ncbi:MAG: sigma-E processing peptidase SpoIIGA [Lachnospiraceae bacterium]
MERNQKTGYEMQNVVIYPDVLAIRCFLICGLLLFVSGKLMRCRINLKKMLITALLEGALLVFFELTFRSVKWINAIGEMAVLFGGFMFCYGLQKRRHCICGFIQMMTGILWLGGMADNWLRMGLSVVFLLLSLAFRERPKLYQVSFMYRGKLVRLDAIIDTGNSLHDPVTHRPVAIMEQACLSPETDFSQTYAIPFHSVGNDNGKISILYLTNVRIESLQSDVLISDFVVGIYPGKLDAGNRFQMLLHPNQIP